MKDRSKAAPTLVEGEGAEAAAHLAPAMMGCNIHGIERPMEPSLKGRMEEVECERHRHHNI